MQPPVVDLRSDTLTQPSPGMREAMARATVGDDVYEEDPTIRALESELAERFGFEAALFVSSGTMGNQLAIACLTRPGDEVIVPTDAHPVLYESGAGAALSGVQFKEVGEHGVFTPEQLTSAVKPVAYYAPRTSLVTLENTHNRSGGRVVPKAVQAALTHQARTLGLATHLDGARIWNASIATGLSLQELARGFDTMTACFSKGLGAPVGSMFFGPKELVVRARRLRKMWGGGMRQVGILGAAARYAFEHQFSRIADDHANAKLLAAKLGSVHCPNAPETNIVQVHTGPAPAAAVTERCAARHVRIQTTGPHELRAVTHLDVDQAGILRAAEVLADAIHESVRTASPEGPTKAGGAKQP
ncbi:MAG: GntG family PLP-dependent aldolase [Polyangiaceae bacterium]